MGTAIGGGIVKGKFGEYLTSEEAALEVALIATLTNRRGRASGVDFGTIVFIGPKNEQGEYTGGLTLNANQSVSVQESEIARALSDTDLEVHSLSLIHI